ncbi:MAG TPA: hypothetical protein PKY10_09970, partial [Lentisphaeria bacterium]|nr:hypothetical protein [Lentisphaeria bacterium]
DTPGWYKDVGTEPLPADCPEWTLWQAEVTAPPSQRSGLYSFGVFATSATGELWVSDFFLLPVSEKAIAESRPAPVIHNNRIIPVAPLLTQVISDDKAEIRFFHSMRIAEDLVEARVAITPVGADAAAFTGRFPVQVGVITVRPGRLPLGRATLAIEIVRRDNGDIIAANTYTITVNAPPPPPPMRQLNNMVAELLAAPLANTIYSFVNPREGWIYISLEQSETTAQATLDDGAEPVVVFRPGEPFSTMRYLSMGEHRLTVAGAGSGRIVIRAVPQLFLYPYFVVPKTDLSIFRYDLDFYRKHIFPNVNIIDAESNYTKEALPELAARGIKFIGSGGFPEATWRDADKMTANILDSWSVKTTVGRTLDELAANAPASVRTAYTQAMWNLVDLDKLIYTWVCGGHLRSPTMHTDVFAAAANVSQGRGKILYETYIVTQPTLTEMEKYLDGFRKYVTDGAKLVEDPASKMMMIMTGLISHGRWNVYTFPEVDIKYFFDRYFHLLANAPEFQGLFGFGCYNIAHTDEETTRWITTIMRHYGIEGRRDLLSDTYGFTYLPGHLRNGDFRDGLDGWQATPAEDDAIVAETIPGYGFTHQHRRRDSLIKNIGDTAAVFTRSDKAPNHLSQTAVNLTQGKLYTLNFAVADLSDIREKAATHPQLLLHASMKQAEVIPDKSFVHHWPTANRPKPQNVAIDSHRILFRALAPEVEITFSDWESPAAAGAPAGQQQVLNFVSLRPYFEEK